MGRLVSVVSSRAALNGSSTPLTKMLRVFFQGFSNARNLPSGESSGFTISGLPKISSRSIRGGRPLVAALLPFVCALSDVAAKAIHVRSEERRVGKECRYRGSRYQ